MENKLLVYNFYNGHLERDASLCNLYDVLKTLKIFEGTKQLKTVCWVRDYAKGYTIKTQEQLDRLLLNEPKRLRISFFSQPVSTIKELQEMLENNEVPTIVDEPLYNLGVYTLWCDGEQLRINKSGIGNVDLLFQKVVTAYEQFYFEEEPRSPTIFDKIRFLKK
jgi:hypothetical protein